MGSPRRSSPTNLHRTHKGNDMRLGSPRTMEPCIVASSSKERDNNISSNKKDAPSPNQGTLTANEDSRNDAPKDTSSSGSTESSQMSMEKAKSALHDGLNGNDKTPLHSAASTRTRRPFFLSRLSSSVGSKQRREAKQRKKELQQREEEERQPLITEDGRNPDESFGADTIGSGTPKAKDTTSEVNSPLAEEPVISPASTVQSAKSNNSGKRRNRKKSMKFLKRALSSPPVLLQRFHSNPNERDWQSTSGRRLTHAGSGSSSSRSSVDLNRNTNMAELTHIVPKSFSPTSNREPVRRRSDVDRTKEDEEEKELVAVNTARCTATSILHHSYLPVLESLCGVPTHPDFLHDTAIQTLETNKRSLFDPPTGKSDLRNQYHRQHPNESSCSWFNEDPTVQESIECIFASQLEDGLKLWEDEIYDDEEDFGGNHPNASGHFDGPGGNRSYDSLEKGRTSSFSRDDGLISPAGVQQSRMNRKDRKDSSKALFANMSQTKKRYEQASLVYVGTFDPSTPKNRVPTGFSDKQNTSLDGSIDASTVYSNLPEDPLPCSCATSFLPSVEPKDWPQAPIALRPTPGSGTKVKAVRFSGHPLEEPLWVPGSHMTWSQRLEQHWCRCTEEEQRKKRDQQPHYACCEKCVLLPINNGNEAPGESLVIDFESELFEGSFMLRLRHSEGTTPEPYDDNKGYFQGMNRRYQCCVRGRFKKVLPFTELMTGFKYGRNLGKLPSKWVLKGALKVVSFFAPQLDIKLEGVAHPYSITPLGSTPQCINVDDHQHDESDSSSGCHGHAKELSGCNSSSNSDDDKPPSPYAKNTIEYSNAKMNLLDGIRVESSHTHRSLLDISHVFEETTSLQRAKFRKKAFDKLYTQKSQHPKTDPSKIYTFEFLQHMVNFQDFSIDLGNMMGSLKLEEILDGQPFQIMASHGNQCLWSFEVWNECLWKQAKKHDAFEQQKLRRQHDLQGRVTPLNKRTAASF